MVLTGDVALAEGLDSGRDMGVHILVVGEDSAQDLGPGDGVTCDAVKSFLNRRLGPAAHVVAHQDGLVIHAVKLLVEGHHVIDIDLPVL